MDMVAIRKGTVEPMVNSPAKQRKPKQPGEGHPEQAKLFGT